MAMPTPEAVKPSSTPDLRPRPFRYGVLPFVVSLLLHAGVVVLGVAAYSAVRTAVSSVTREQIVIPEMGPIQNDPVGGTLHPGGMSNPTRTAAQSDLPDVKDASGLSNKPAHDLTKLLGGEPGEMPLTVGMVSANQAISRWGLGGDGESADGTAPFGVAGGEGGPGRGPGFMKTPATNARRIVFLCDASGSMMRNFDLLRVELRKAVEGLRPPQAFNVLFFQENARPPLEKGLIFVTPENKRRAYDYVDTCAARGPTDPLPALRIALEMKPELIYFLIDPSDFPDKPAVLELFRKANVDKRMKVTTIAFINRKAEDEAFLKQLAAENGGVFKYVSEDELGR